MVGNKCDLAGEREVSREQGLDFAHQIGAMFTETSAARNSGVCVCVCVACSLSHYLTLPQE